MAQRTESGWMPPPIHVDRTPGYTLEIREQSRRLSVEPIPDPFINTTVHPRGWRVALAVLLRRYKVEVIVGGERESVERVCYLDPDYLGERGSERRASWDRHFNRALGDFAACLAEHEDDE